MTRSAAEVFQVLYKSGAIPRTIYKWVWKCVLTVGNLLLLLRRARHRPRSVMDAHIVYGRSAFVGHQGHTDRQTGAASGGQLDVIGAACITAAQKNIYRQVLWLRI